MYMYITVGKKGHLLLPLTQRCIFKRVEVDTWAILEVVENAVQIFF